MQAALHSVGVGAQRLGIGIGIVVICAVLAYVGLVFLIVAGQAAKGLGL